MTKHKCSCPPTCDCKIINSNLVEDVMRSKPEESEFISLAKLFKIMGDQTRLKIIWTLDRSDMCVCDIANVLNMTKSSISHQLATLRDAGVVTFRKDGKEVYYKLDDDHIKELYEVGLDHIEHKMKGEK